jgi:hypothetical protein
MKQFLRNKTGATVSAVGKGRTIEFVLVDAPSADSPTATVEVRGGRSYQISPGEIVDVAHRLRVGVVNNDGNPQIYFKASNAYDVSGPNYPSS